MEDKKLTYREVVARGEIAQDKYITTDDAPWSDRAFIKYLHDARAEIIRRDMKHGNTYRRLRQTPECLPLDKVLTEDCPCAPPSGHVWKRSREQLPTMIGEPLSVHSIGGDLKLIRRYDYIDWYNYKYVAHSPYAGERDRAYYTEKGGYVYLIPGDVDKEKFLAVTAIYFDPIKVFTLPNCAGTVNRCADHMDFEFLIDPTTVKVVVDMAVDMYMRSLGRAPRDTTNDAQPAQEIEPVKSPL